jgi:hypothetical protein
MDQNWNFLVVNCTSSTLYGGNVMHTAGNQTVTTAVIPAEGLKILQTTSVTPFYPEDGKKDKWSWSYSSVPNGPVTTGSLDCEVKMNEDSAVVVVLTDEGATVVRMKSKGPCYN